MRERVYSVTLGLLFSLLFQVHFAHPSDVIGSWDKKTRVPIRPQIAHCKVFLTPHDAAAGEDSDSVGVLVAQSHDIDELKTNLAKIIHEQGLEKVENSDLFVTGVDMGWKNEREVKRRYEVALRDLGVPGVRVRLLSIPKAEVTGFLNKVVNGWRKFLYFLPSWTRDVQHPILGEWFSGTLVTLGIEAPNVIYLVNRAFSGALPALDASLMITAHFLTLGIYDLYTKTLGNWLLRPYRITSDSGYGKFKNAMGGFFAKMADLGLFPKTSRSISKRWTAKPDPSLPPPEVLFVRQMTLSLPFILNYSVLGSFTKIQEFIHSHAPAEVAQAFGTAATEFAFTQGPTTVLQTLFYQNVISRGIDNWVNQQEGTERVTAARILKQWIRLPILALDALALALCTQLGGEPLAQVGPFKLMIGHVALGVLLWQGSKIKGHTNLLDRLLDWYVKRRARSGVIAAGVGELDAADTEIAARIKAQDAEDDPSKE